MKLMKTFPKMPLLAAMLSSLAAQAFASNTYSYCGAIDAAKSHPEVAKEFKFACLLSQDNNGKLQTTMLVLLDTLNLNTAHQLPMALVQITPNGFSAGGPAPFLIAGGSPNDPRATFSGSVDATSAFEHLIVNPENLEVVFKDRRKSYPVSVPTFKEFR